MADENTINNEMNENTGVDPVQPPVPEQPAVEPTPITEIPDLTFTPEPVEEAPAEQVAAEPVVEQPDPVEAFVVEQPETEKVEAQPATEIPDLTIDVEPEPVVDPVEEAPVQEPAATEPVVEEVTTEEPVAPVEEKPKKPKKGKRILFVLIGAVAIFAALVVFALFLFLNTGENNPLFQALGVESGNISSFLRLIAVIATGGVSLLSFLGVIAGIFKFMNSKRDDKKGKKKGLFMLIASVLLFAVALTGFIFSFSKLGDPISVEVNESYIVTSPAETIGLTSPVDVVFDATQIPIDTKKFRVISYTWSFGDGENATGPNVSHTYTKKPADGIYTATLKVSYQDANNPSGEIFEETFTKVIAIENESVFAVFTADPEEGGAPLTVEFDATESFDPDGDIVMYEWDFNEDGIFDADGDTVIYTFEEVGTYNVTLQITDNNGEFTTTEGIINVKSDQIIQAVITNTPADQVLVPDRAYQFDASASTSDEGTITKYEWNFGDGNPKVGRKVTHAYEREGVYTISLTLEDDAGNQRLYEKDVTVSSSASGLFARISTFPEISDGQIAGVAPLRVNLDASQSSGGDIVDYQWDFDGNGQFEGNGQIVDHAYTVPGEYNLQLRIVSADDKTATANIKVVVESPGLQAKVTANPVNGEVPLDVTFDASSTRVPEGLDVVTFRWDFGDGTPIKREGSRVTHRYTRIGIFTAKVEAITSDNQISEATVTVHVNTTPLQACYKTSRKIGPAPMTVIFDPSCTTGTAQNYTWDFGGAGVSNERRPVFTFTEPGVYEVDLEVVDSDNSVSHFVDTITVQ